MTPRALVIVDVQNDFCEGGRLAVPGGAAVARVVGLATSLCDRATALDAVAAGLRTRLLLGWCADVAGADTEGTLAELAAAGVEVAR